MRNKNESNVIDFVSFKYKKLLNSVRNNSGFLTVEMKYLRNISGYGKLGPHVISEISKMLHDHGMCHYPERLPSNQNENLRILLQGSSAHLICKSVTNIDDDGDKFLKNILRNLMIKNIEDMFKRDPDMLSDPEIIAILNKSIS